MRLLVDTGATTTFVHSHLLDKLSPSRPLQPNPYSFFLADGRAPFHVLGTIELSIRFADVTTHVKAHVAQHLCTDIILGMDYINAYNLTINIKRQTLFIEHNKHTLIVPIDPSTSLNSIPTIASQSITVVPQDTSAVSELAPRSSLPLSSTYHLSLIHI